jgi:hypothetical protein
MCVSGCSLFFNFVDVPLLEHPTEAKHSAVIRISDRAFMVVERWRLGDVAGTALLLFSKITTTLRSGNVCDKNVTKPSRTDVFSVVFLTVSGNINFT